MKLGTPILKRVLGVAGGGLGLDLGSILGCFGKVFQGFLGAPSQVFHRVAFEIPTGFFKDSSGFLLDLFRLPRGFSRDFLGVFHDFLGFLSGTSGIFQDCF